MTLQQHIASTAAMIELALEQLDETNDEAPDNQKLDDAYRMLQSALKLIKSSGEL